MPFEWGAAGRPFPGEIASGDAYLANEVQGGLLMAVVDGLGHGVEAAIAASAAIRTLENSSDRPLVSLFELCHAALKETRGVAMSVAHCSDATGRLTWLGVGNVEAIVVRVEDGKIDHIPLRGGVVGMTLPTLRVSEQLVAPGDLIVFASDGIRSRFFEHLDPRGDPWQIADRILSEYGRGTDDAMVLVVRFLGPIA